LSSARADRLVVGDIVVVDPSQESMTKEGFEKAGANYY